MNSDLSSWLESDPRWPKFYYADIEAKKWYAGVGAKSFLKIDAKLSTKSVEKNLREFTKTNGFVFCGIRFDTQSEHANEWDDFGTAQFIAPEILREGTLFETPTSGGSRPSTPPPLDADWEELFRHASNDFSDRRLKKVVLARRDRIKKTDDVWKRMMHAPGPFRFAFSPKPGHVFYGASPELLFRKEGMRIQSDALAGTRPSNVNAENELLENTKDRFEHQLVVEFLVDRLTNFCGQVDVSETKIKHLEHLIHLHTLVWGTMNAGDLVFSHLHPTPALCGTPQETALAFLREHEGFDRGWYGGAVGVIDDDFESFAVAIRSVLQTPSDAFVYFGAGVVPDSNCSAEWAEIHSKRSAILSNLGEAL